jgi:hypothetical protein
MKGTLLAFGLAAAVMVTGGGLPLSHGAAQVVVNPGPAPDPRLGGGGIQTVIPGTGVVIRGPGIYGAVRVPGVGIYGGIRPGGGYVRVVPGGRIPGAGPYVAYRPAYAQPLYNPYAVRTVVRSYSFPLFAGYSLSVNVPQTVPVDGAVASAQARTVRPASATVQPGLVRSPVSPRGSGLVRPPSPSESGLVRPPSSSGSSAPERSGAGATESGLRITNVTESGVAKQVDLRAGDVILGVGEKRTQTFEELQAALAAATDETDIIFINGENGQVERLPIKPVNGKIGVSVVLQELK